MTRHVLGHRQHAAGQQTIAEPARQFDDCGRLLRKGAVTNSACGVGKGDVEDRRASDRYSQRCQLRGDEPPPEEVKPSRRRSFFSRRSARSTSGIRVSGHTDVLVRFGRCCVPLPGDEVVGFVTRGRGVTVHVKDCSKAFALDDARRIDVEWDSDASVPRRIKIRVISVDQPGLLAKVTKTISAAGINIGAARVTTTQEQKAIQTFDVWLSDVATLHTVMKQIQRIRGVYSVERLRT